MIAKKLTKCLTPPIQILGDLDREPGRLRDLDYESEDETEEEEREAQNPSSAR